MNISEAAKTGVSRLRKPHWPTGDVLELYLVNGGYGPWATLKSEIGARVSPELGEQKILLIGAREVRDEDWEPAP
jgi:hypothetical protein